MLVTAPGVGSVVGPVVFPIARVTIVVVSAAGVVASAAVLGPCWLVTVAAPVAEAVVMVAGRAGVSLGAGVAGSVGEGAGASGSVPVIPAAVKRCEQSTAQDSRSPSND